MPRKRKIRESRSEPDAQKPSITERTIAPFREAAALADTLVRRPRRFLPDVIDLVRRAFRRVWKARGGGLYACGFFVTFVVFEIRLLAGDLLEADGVSDFVTGQLFELIIRFSVESMQNTLLAFLWPVYVLEYRPPWGLAGLVAAYLLFPVSLKPVIERWLFADEPTVIDDKEDLP